MAPVAKRQKVSRENRLNQTLINRPDIRSFGKISKVTIEAASKKDNPVQIAPKDGIARVESLLNAAIASSSSKLQEDTPLKNKTGYTSNESSAKKDSIKVTPQKRQRHGISDTFSEAETPTKGARTILDAFKISSPSSKGNSKSVSKSITSTEEKEPELLPEPLQDLVRLYSSFLTALSLHFAHHGCLTPVDLRQCTPSIERTWGKRSVVVEDIRRLLGVANSCMDTVGTSIPTLGLSDFGNGRVCIELLETNISGGVLARPLDEQKLNSAFEEQTNRLWMDWHSQRSKDSEASLDNANLKLNAALEFIGQLPKASINLCPSVEKMAPLLSKGQSRLEEFKIGALEKKAKAIEAANRHNTQKGKSAVDRKEALLSRVSPPPHFDTHDLL
jgi:hypothetical protein